jgi:hypothetical protein
MSELWCVSDSRDEAVSQEFALHVFGPCLDRRRWHSCLMTRAIRSRLIRFSGHVPKGTYDIPRGSEGK